MRAGIAGPDPQWQRVTCAARIIAAEADEIEIEAAFTVYQTDQEGDTGCSRPDCTATV